VIQTLDNQAFTEISFAKAKARINYLNTKNTKKIPTKPTKTLVLLCDYLYELCGKLDSISCK
jgi:hypothetical protein